MALLGIVLSVIAFDLYIHFERVPESAGDRWRFMPGSTQATVQQCLIKYQLDRRRYQDSLLGRDDPRWARAERVLQQLIVANGLEGCLQRDIISVEGNKWELMVIDVKYSPLLKATIAPGSKVILSTSFIDFCATDSELAQVLTQQMAHVLLEHWREIDSKQRFYQPLIYTAMAVWWPLMLICIPIVGWIDSRVFGEANRARELEADRWGVALAVQAGFDRNAAPAIWRKLASSSSSFNVNGPNVNFAPDRVAAMQCESGMTADQMDLSRADQNFNALSKPE